MSTTLSALTILLLVFSQGLRLPALTNESSLPKPIASPSFYKTSFDCTKVKDQSVEQAICENVELAKLDLEMATAYKKRLESVPMSQKSELVLSQRKWLMIRNAYNLNPYHGDPVGTLSDLSDFYRNRIAALQSGQLTLVKTELPQEYAWFKAIAPEGFDKGFSIGRGYMSCEDPCKKKPSLYKLFSIGGGGIGEPPGDVDTPFAKIENKLASEGWTKCRSADDSGKPTIDYFKKKDKMIAMSRYYSMGVGNGIGLSITTSAPLSENPPKLPPNPAVTVTSDWMTYSSPDVRLQVRYPPGWWMRDASVPNSGTKYLTFAAKDYTGSFRISMQSKEMWSRQSVIKNDEEADQKCLPSPYRISGFPSQGCLHESENVGDGTCNRYLESVDIETGRYHLSFEPDISGSVVEDSNQYKFTDLYEKILSTIKMN